MPVRLQPFAGPDALARGLASEVANCLRRALAERGSASLAVSGGTTPARFLRQLSGEALDWSRVRVTLVDERWVDEANPRSNASLVRTHLLQGPAAAAGFVPLYRPRPEPETALSEVDAAIAALLPLDVAVLGMGGDGHTASFFPCGDRLAEAIDPATAARVLPMRAEGAVEPRITLTLPVLASARHLFLHIEGAAKRQVLEQALAGSGAALPIAAVLQAVPGLPVYWSP